MSTAPPNALEEIVEDFAREIRQDIDKGQFACLSSLLWKIGRELLADEVGLLEDGLSSSGFAVKRRITAFNSTFSRSVSDEEIANAIGDLVETGADYSTALPGRFRWFRVNSNEVSQFKLPARPPSSDGSYLLWLVSIWPSPHWNAPPHSRYWAYVLNPCLANAGYGADRPGLGGEVLRLVVDWMAWKHGLLSYRERSLQTRTSPKDIQPVAIGALKYTAIQPVLPRQFSHVLQHLIGDIEKTKDTSWIDHADLLVNHIEDIREACKPCDSDADCIGCKIKDLCPQNDHSSRIDVITGLYIWQTRFWYDALAGQSRTSPTFASLLEKASNGLKSAANALDMKGSDDLSLQHGRERLLLRFFTARAIHDALVLFERRWNVEKLAAQVSELHFLACLAKLAVLLLTDDEWKPEAIRNLIRVMAGYGHLILGVPAWLDLARHLRQTLRGESALYTLKQRYRDHFFHTIEVCLIGFSLLVSQPRTKRRGDLAELILAKCRGVSKPGVNSWETAPAAYVPANENDLRAQWWVAALVHDTAYGIDVLKGTLDLLSYFQNQKAIEAFGTKVKTGIKELHQQIASVAPELAKDESLDGGDHGVIAASHLVESLRKHGEQWVERYRPAVRAIAFHNTKFPRVDAARDPIAALLILCDTVQDWGRSQLGFDRSPTVVLSRLVSSAGTPHEDQFGPVKEFSMSMQPQRPNGDWQPCTHVWEQPKSLTITLDYGKKARKGPTVLFTWADTTHNLRRVDFSAWDLEFRIKHRIPLDKHDGHGQTKMGEFAKHVREQEAGYLEQWITEACAGNEQGALCYKVEDEWETLTFNVLELGRTYTNGEPLMGATLAQFGKFADAAYGKQDQRDDHDPEQRPPM